ncbi:GNAT family N-acetyltransferase [Thiothrix nivea]|uniref:GCN5-related N-acetyltransferase n=1 Tax=Thiothrix nivea (strain ATCC 35100 / DSM 5205 / JP2) TaxID=870187 RepID=A0A656HJN2_THINJ|nr:GNAT family N-acetyltransferase [Thiothrix nivea]EIJ35225.1 GCN5-related N-acetyltransferase [Thiothrix nivea DSM 5205]
MTAGNPLSIVMLAPQHDRSAFDCGQDDLNRYLQQVASQHQKKQVSRTWVAVRPSEPERIVGFYTTTLAEISAEYFNPKDLKKLPKTSLPVARLSRLAVGQQYQGQHIGQRLLIDAIVRTARLLEDFAVVGMVVDAKDEAVSRYYQHFGFVPWQDDALKLYMPAQALLDVYAAVIGE